jgi:hypothetical protein
MWGFLSVVDPSRHGEVGRLGAVEAVVIAGVVGVWECDYKLTGFLSCLKIYGFLFLIFKINRTKLQVKIEIFKWRKKMCLN